MPAQAHSRRMGLKKARDIAEIEKMTVLLREKNISSFIFTWKPRLDFMLKTEKK